MADEPAYIKNFKAFTRGQLTNIDDLRDFENEIYGQNDRATAVILSSMVETHLERRIQDTFRPELNSADRHILFGADGPLGNFSAKTTLAFAMGIIGPKTRKDLDLIRLLRNEFAHSRKHFGFETPQVAAVVSRLASPDIPGSYIPQGPLSRIPTKADQDKTHPRTRFRSACFSIVVILMDRSASEF